MAVPKHLEDAAARLEKAHARIKEIRTQEATPANLKAWLEALTDMCLAVSDIQSFDNESVHEKLHALASRTGVKDFS